MRHANRSIARLLRSIIVEPFFCGTETSRAVGPADLSQHG